MWGAWAAGACPPLLLDGCPCPQPAACAHATSAWPPHSALPSVQWRNRRGGVGGVRQAAEKEGLVEMEEAETLGWTPGCSALGIPRSLP